MMIPNSMPATPLTTASADPPLPATDDWRLIVGYLVRKHARSRDASRRDERGAAADLTTGRSSSAGAPHTAALAKRRRRRLRDIGCRAKVQVTCRHRPAFFVVFLRRSLLYYVPRCGIFHTRAVIFRTWAAATSSCGRA